ncbi:MAG TPA: CHRD domain-containing protein [Burkholderiales bacterium]|nr:CHRD domain-containing protein [Burkholderiales bacterium]
MPTPTRAFPVIAAAALAVFALAAPASAQTFKAELSGAANVPDPVKTPATGHLELTVAANGQSINYVLTVKDIENVIEGDIHLGPAVANGPLVVKLFHGGAKKGPFNGVLAQGKIDAADLAGPMGGAKLSELIDELKAGNAYVNVHTSDGVDPPNSGPGDYRLGEIRGQIK